MPPKSWTPGRPRPDIGHPRKAPRRGGCGRSVALLGCALLAASPAAGQRPEAIQLASVLAGWTRMTPLDDGGLEEAGLDDGSTARFGLALERRQARGLYLYGRLDGDAAEVRQHLAATGGLRFVLSRPSPSIQPYVGAGIGLLWLEPRLSAFRLQREYAPQIEAMVGLDWQTLPELRWILEYRLTGARASAIGIEPGCNAASREECIVGSAEPVTHLGHTVWVGIRITMF